jgi:hypothetical protein
MRQFILVSSSIILMASAALAGEGSGPLKTSNPHHIDSTEFNGFEECNSSSKLKETINRLIRTRTPDKKEEAAWTYKINSEAFDLPVKAMMVGVCDTSGGQECGAASFLAVVIPRPLNKVKIHLKSKFGSDFTKENREKEFNATLRPVLWKGENPGESILFCDSGDL